jgi:bifunctional DNA-binding transcriptional regulator/antitoxin component of YhaV-PrlF toxin-antitoxin module
MPVRRGRRPLPHLERASAVDARLAIFPADARKAMRIKEGDKVVVLHGPREGSILVFRVDSFDKLLDKATGAEA